MPKRGRSASASITNALVVARAVFASVHGEPLSRYAPSVSADPRGVAIARSVRERIATLEELVRDANDEQWSRICPSESWPVGLETYHIALGLARQGGWIIDRLAGAPAHDFSWEETNVLNALIAQTQGWRAKGEVLRFLADQTDRVVDLLLRLSATDWSLDAMTFGEMRRSAEFVMKVVALRHIDDHTRSIRAALPPSRTPAPSQ